MPKHLPYTPERWIEIAKNRGFIVLNLDSIDPDKPSSTNKLELQCIECKVITQPTISDLTKSRNANKRCKCQTWKSKREADYKDSDDWKVISKLDNFFSRRHKLDQVQSYYVVSRHGQVKNAAINNDLDQPSISDETYARVSLRTINNKSKSIGISILVACAFVPIPELPDDQLQNHTVDHIDGDTINNESTNLRWASPSQQSFNRKSMRKSGQLFIQDQSVYFSADDFKLHGNQQLEPIIKQYDHFHERIKIEDDISLPNEIWKRVDVNGSKYLVSSEGRGYYDAWSKASWGSLEPEGYMIFQDHRMHRLIAKAFLSDQLKLLGIPEDQSDVHHINDRKCDNRAENLRYETSSGNTRESINSMIRATKASSKSSQPKGTPVPVHQLDSNKNIIQSFPSIIQASESSKISERRIQKSIKHYDKTHELVFHKGMSWQRQFSATSKEDNSNNSNIISMSKAEFQTFKSTPDACSTIMKLLEPFKSPILPVITIDQCKSDWFKLSKDTEIINNTIQASNRGRKLLNHFMYQVMIKGHTQGSPTYIECWNDLQLREKLIRRMLTYDESMSNGSLLGCYGCLYGRLYNFPPNISKAIYNHVNAKRVLDFCAGFGGRLLGFWASAAEEYIGIDPNTEIPYTELLNFLLPFKSKSARIITACAEDVNYEELGTFDTIFTSPPYFNTEIYSTQPTQSSSRYTTIEEWLNKFLFATLNKVIKVLAPSGTLLINIKDSKKHAIVEPMLSHLRKISTLQEQIPIKILQSKRHRNNTRYEYIYIFKKLY
jgi:DNA methylase/HNH endonuclease